jgi:hypothetical protein
MNKIDLTGKTFGRLQVVQESTTKGRWDCICECGSATTKVVVYLRSGHTKSCGKYPNDGKRYTIDRRDNAKGYEPGNIRWADDFQQARNKGMSIKNRTGFTGVTLDNKGTENLPKFYYKVQWRDLASKVKTKCFSVEKYGEELAFFLSCTYREHQIDLLNLQGAGYANNHGKAGYNAAGGQCNGHY